MTKRLVGGVFGAFLCSILVGVSFLFIKTMLLQLDITVLLSSGYFYVFSASLVGVVGSLCVTFTKTSDIEVDIDEPVIRVSSEKVGSSGVLGEPIKLKPGRVMSDNLDMTIETEFYYYSEKAPMAPEEPKPESKKERRFFETIAAV